MGAAAKLEPCRPSCAQFSASTNSALARLVYRSFGFISLSRSLAPPARELELELEPKPWIFPPPDNNRSPRANWHYCQGALGQLFELIQRGQTALSPLRVSSNSSAPALYHLPRPLAGPDPFPPSDGAWKCWQYAVKRQDAMEYWPPF